MWLCTFLTLNHFNLEADLFLSHSHNSILSWLYLIPEASISNVPQKYQAPILDRLSPFVLCLFYLFVCQKYCNVFSEISPLLWLCYQRNRPILLFIKVIFLPLGRGQAKVKHFRHDSKKYDSFSQHWYHNFMWPWYIGLDSKSGLSYKYIFPPSLQQFQPASSLMKSFEEIPQKEISSSLLYFYFCSPVDFYPFCSIFFSHTPI